MEMFSSTLKPGTTLNNGTYRIECTIGRGGFGITYLALNTQLGMHVAIKEFFPKGMLNRDDNTSAATVASKDNGILTAKLKNKFIKESQRIASLKHRSIVSVTNAFEENGTAYYVMDFIEGSDLNVIVRKEGPLSVDSAVDYVTQVGEALEYLHSRRINHLDVKPANILVEKSTNRPILIDFGLSKQYDSNDHQTSTTPVGVSEGYAPIEQYKSGGVHEFSAATDIYALGATLYFLLTGQRPPSANDLVEDGLSFPSSVPGYLQEAISHAMAPRRAVRYHSVSEFLAAINSPSSTHPEDDTDNKPEGVSKSKKIVVIFILVLAAIALGVGIFFLIDRHETSLPPASQYIMDEEDAIDPEEAARLEAIRQDSIARRNFTSPDLDLCDLHGKVESCRWENHTHLPYKLMYNGNTLRFSRDGFLEIPATINYKRNGNGQIINFNCSPNPDDFEYYIENYFSIDYKWLNNKISATDDSFFEGGDKDELFYDQEGLLIKANSESYMNSITEKITVTYTDYEFDEMGNWIKRKVKYVTMTYDMDEFTDKSENTETETRTITYYN